MADTANICCVYYNWQYCRKNVHRGIQTYSFQYYYDTPHYWRGSQSVSIMAVIWMIRFFGLDYFCMLSDHTHYRHYVQTMASEHRCSNNFLSFPTNYTLMQISAISLSRSNIITSSVNEGIKRALVVY